MALYQNGTLISGANTLPKMTLAEYQALPVSDRPTYWERTDLNYNNIPASNVTYGSGSVEDALNITDNAFSITYNSDKVTGGANPTCVRIGNIGLVSGYFMTKTALVADDVIFTLNGVTPLKRTIAIAYKNNESKFFVIKDTANSQNITVDTTPLSATANNEYYLYNMILLLAD